MTELCGRKLTFGDNEQLKEFKKINSEAPFCPKCNTLGRSWWDWDCGDYFECPNCWCAWWKENGKIKIFEE